MKENLQQDSYRFKKKAEYKNYLKKGHFFLRNLNNQNDFIPSPGSYYDTYYGEVTDAKYGKIVYIGFEQELVTNYDQYYYYYSGDRNPDYYYDENSYAEDEYIGEWIEDAWSRNTTKIIVFTVIIIFSITLLMWLIIKLIGDSALDFRPSWQRAE